MRTVIQGGGVKHLVTMATSEHMIMQNEALVALGLIAALDLGKLQAGSMIHVVIICDTEHVLGVSSCGYAPLLNFR